MFRQYYITDYSIPPKPDELKPEERVLYYSLGKDERVWDVFNENMTWLSARGFRFMMEIRGNAYDAAEYERPFCPVDALDSGLSLAEETAVEASSWSLAIFNAPNHGTYGMKPQGPANENRQIEFGAAACIAMAQALPNTTIMSLNVGRG